MSEDCPKWSCEYCTYENYPNALKCTMCRGPKPLICEDIYKIRPESSPPASASGPAKAQRCDSKWNCEVCNFLNQAWAKDCSECRSCKPQVTSTNLHEHLKPLRISDSLESVTGAIKQPKWSCPACTYENWPKAKKCVMCGSVIAGVSPSHSLRLTSPERDLQPVNEDINVSKRLRQKEEGDRLWLSACLAVVQNDIAQVEAYLASGGTPTRQLTHSDIVTLNRPSAFDVGYTLVHLAIRFKREEMLALLVASLESSGSGLKRVPSYVAPQIAQAIRRHAATLLTSGKLFHSLNCPYFTEFNTFYLPYGIEELGGYMERRVYAELLDKDAMCQLEGECVINWSGEGSRLHALWNRSQGDCLLDSLMQAQWGVFDRDRLLRRALADTIHHAAHLLYPRWVEFEANEARKLDFSVSESQWAEDWAGLVSRASQPGASLQQLHVFALAHVLRRPIIVYGVKVVKSFRGEDLGYAGFEGVYLPLLWEPSFCSTSPLCLGYTRGHFSALVGIEPYPPAKCQADGIEEIITLLPLVDSDRKLLPVHFLTKAESMLGGERLLRQWLDVNVTEGGLLVALQKSSERPLLVSQMLHEWLNHYRDVASRRQRGSGETIPSNEASSEGESDDD